MFSIGNKQNKVDSSDMNVGKYIKLTDSDPCASESDSQPTNPSTDSRRTTWCVGQNEAETVPDEVKKPLRHSDNLEVPELRSVNSILGTSKLKEVHKSAPELTVSTCEGKTIPDNWNTDLTESKSQNYLKVKLRNPIKSKSQPTTPLRTRKRQENTKSVFVDHFDTTEKKQRPSSTAFGNLAIMKLTRKEPVKDETCSLLEALNNKKLKAAFQSFLEFEYSSENLEFWSACQKYKKSKNLEAQIEQAQFIYESFISANGASQINIDFVRRENIKKLMACGKAPINLFECAERYIFAIMESDPFPRFLDSAAYKAASRKKSPLMSMFSNRKTNNNNNNNNERAYSKPCHPKMSYDEFLSSISST